MLSPSCHYAPKVFFLKSFYSVERATAHHLNVNFIFVAWLFRGYSHINVTSDVNVCDMFNLPLTFLLFHIVYSHHS